MQDCSFKLSAKLFFRVTGIHRGLFNIINYGFCFSCPSCPYAACRRDMITRHMRIHLKGDPGTPSIGAASTLDQAKGRQKRNRLRELIRSQSAEDAPPSSPALNITGLSVRSPTPSEMEADG